MTLTLKSTILASTTIAIVLNLGQSAVSYFQQAEAAYAPSWATEAVASSHAPTPIATKAQLQPLPTPIATPASPVATPSNATSAAASKLSIAGLNPVFAPSYLAVAAKTGTPWQILAAVHYVETGQSGDTSRSSYAGAVGPMQFMPGTFAHYAQDGDGNGTRDITNFQDALLTAGHYLAAGGAARGNYQMALFNYNHSESYVTHVLGIAHRLGL
jgi:hypothetical protein